MLVMNIKIWQLPEKYVDYSGRRENYMFMNRNFELKMEIIQKNYSENWPK